uniref:Tyrosine-protein kinase receptor n=1 Tax=Wuchereria bancrofti TaxID=6293 RepID=A0A1I8EZR6_WUCBA
MDLPKATLSTITVKFDNIHSLIIRSCTKINFLKHKWISGILCDFESKCDWMFESPARKYPRDPRYNFKVVVGSRDSKPTHYAYFNFTKTREEPAMIISPYYQYLSIQCELRFIFRLIGDPDATLIVTSQHRALNEAASYADLYDYEDETEWTRPTLHSTFNAQNNYIDSWKEVGVHIGHVTHPTRIRIECHSKGSGAVGASKENTECYIDNIEMVKCDEEVWYENVCQSNKTKKYLCHKYDHPKCIDYDQLCDMTVDCPGAEDEQTDLHNCTVVPLGARCTFEDDNEEKTGCVGWRLETYYVHNSRRADENKHLFVRVNSSGAAKQSSLKHVPPRDHTFEHTNNSGHFLYFTSEDGQDRNSFTDTKSTYLISPYFPPTVNVLLSSVALLSNSCRIRFYYCSYGSAISTLQLTVHPTNGQPPKIIWTPPSLSFADHSYYCEWMKVSIDLPEQKTEYYLKIGVSRIFDSSISFAIDDFSMTPDCFANEAWSNTQYVPYVYNITSCGRQGAQPPTSETCENFYNQSSTKILLRNNTSNGFQKWIVPKTSEYRIEAYGASGGHLAQQTINNYGGQVISVLNLTVGMELNILVGQMGESPCDHFNTEADGMKSHQYEVLKYLCKKGNSIWNDNSALTNAVMFPGTGGGGATIVKYQNMIILVAGGGGGIFPEQIISLEKPGVNPTGGYLFEADKNSQPNDLYNPKRGIQWMAGDGAHLVHDNKKDKYEQCIVMSGQLNNVSSSGGECPLVSVWKILGGYGGGGASCGPGGGGGAGYHGGEGGQKYHGDGGKSFAHYKSAVVRPGMNSGNGYVLIHPCRLRCSQNATCRFRFDNTAEVGSYCACPDGQIVGELQDCLFGENKKKKQINIRRKESLLVMLVFAFVLCTIILLSAFGSIYFRRRLKKAKIEKVELNHEIGMCTLTPSTPMSISGNPIYEPFGPCAELQPIPRANVALIRPLGQGAFGEVYEGTLNCGSQSVQVAVKTLPKSASKQAVNDFEMEALIMSKFRHENICELMGVCFDVTPRLIILELLAGGDLKSFLRECRPKNTKDQRIQMIDLLDMAQDVAKGCKFLADNRFIHRDIAARNCLLTKKEVGRVVKIADFGMARDIYRQDYYRKGGKAMLPVKWMPPEAFLDGVFTVKTDVWSFGVLLWEIFSLGYMPYPGRSNQEVMSLIVNGGRLEPPNGIPDQIYSLMLACWSTADTDRPHFDYIIENLDSMLQNPVMQSMPLPAIIYRLSQSQSAPNNSSLPDSPSSVTETVSQNNYSQSTINTILNSYTETIPSNDCDPLPTKGDGVNFNVCTPYHPQSSEPFCTLDRTQSRPLSLWANGQLPSGSTETCTSDSGEAASNCNDNVLSTMTLHNVVAGSRRPVVDADSCNNRSISSDYANAIRTEVVSLLERRYPPPMKLRVLPSSTPDDFLSP